MEGDDTETEINLVWFNPTGSLHLEGSSKARWKALRTRSSVCTVCTDGARDYM